jgi:hypothetical protein
MSWTKRSNRKMGITGSTKSTTRLSVKKAWKSSRFLKVNSTALVEIATTRSTGNAVSTDPSPFRSRAPEIPASDAKPRINFRCGDFFILRSGRRLFWRLYFFLSSYFLSNFKKSFVDNSASRNIFLNKPFPKIL